MPTPRRFFLLWALLTLAGAALIALPDDNDRVFSFTADHGPSPVDLVGMLLMVAGFVAYLVGLALARRALTPPLLLPALAGYLAGCALAGWSVSTDTGWWWLLGVLVALGAQAWLAWRVTA